MHHANPGQSADLIASSAGVLFTRVAAAAARKGAGDVALAVERDAVRSVLERLRSEIEVLRGERAATVVDEPAYAMAGFTLDALRTGHAMLDDEQAALLLESLIRRLEALDGVDPLSTEDATWLEDLFLAGGRYATLALSDAGERTLLLQ
ncbi:hypothetical protein [Microbacterium sp. Bi128]|uniref:hypothetical protein n=1 Tax=Microbacterium sp. Bi128 TaxID=2821115 RepID=UPI001DB9565B|nr:hypothetical protein [Microbacterium sp. Bi128]CAH0137589.1 hypothetical protein SRABI128_00226 [Microbacterium sp. Bi128]